MEPGTFTYHLNVPVKMSRLGVNMPIDVVIKRMGCNEGSLPLLVECKSAGDFTNTNKRRKEEAQKIEQLKTHMGTILTLFFSCVDILIVATSATKRPKVLTGYGNIG